MQAKPRVKIIKIVDFSIEKEQRKLQLIYLPLNHNIKVHNFKFISKHTYL